MYREIEEIFFQQLKEKTSDTVYNIWFKDLKITDLNESSITLATTSAFKIKILQDRHYALLNEVLENTLGFPVKIVFALLTENNQESIQTTIPVAKVPQEEKEQEIKDESKDRIEGKDLISGYTFQNFVVGDSNRFAYAACYAVAQSFKNDEESLTNPLEEKFNPLFIYGPSGLGKTHLLYAITNEIKSQNPAVNLVYVRGEDFANQLIDAIKEKDTQSFHEKYRNADVLLIDDIHFIAGKESTQEEFFNTFNALHENQKQIILTSDRPPREIKNLSERIRTRFEWGLTADIQPPTPELRAAIIKMKAERQGIELSDEIIQFMADKIKSNIRTIEGSIRKLYAIHILTNSPITLDNAKRALADVQSGTNENSYSFDRIFNLVSKYYDIPIDTIKGKRRNENIVYARHMCMYLLRNNTTFPLVDIGSFFDCKHSSVILACNKIEELLHSSQKTKEEVEYFSNQLKN